MAVVLAAQAGRAICGGESAGTESAGTESAGTELVPDAVWWLEAFIAPPDDSSFWQARPSDLVSQIRLSGRFASQI